MNTNRKDRFREIERDIRCGRAPYSPELLCGYLSDGGVGTGILEESAAKDFLGRLIVLRAEVICDTSIPYHWRCLCLDNLHRLMRCLYEKVRTPKERIELNRKKRGIKALAGYFSIQ